MRRVGARVRDLEGLRSLTEFILSRAAGHAEELNLEFREYEAAEEAGLEADLVAPATSVAAELAAAVAACAVARPLSRLRLSLMGDGVPLLSVGAWLLPARASLRRLHLSVAMNAVEKTFWSELATPLQGFTALEALHVFPGISGFLTPGSAASLRLPCSLTALSPARLPDTQSEQAVLRQVRAGRALMAAS